MNQTYEDIRNYLRVNSGKPFDHLGLDDESLGKFVKKNRVLNKFFIRHLKKHIAPCMDTGEIASFVYRDIECRKIIEASGFWTTRRRDVVFWYSWCSI